MADFYLSGFKPTEYARYRTITGNDTLLNLDFCVVTNGNCNLTLPSSPSAGNKVAIIADVNSTLEYVGGKINIVVASTQPIEGDGNYFVIDVNDTATILTYFNSTAGWRIS